MLNVHGLAEQQSKPRAKMSKLNKEARDRAEQDGDGEMRCPGQADQESSRPEDARSNYNIIQNTKTARQCHTIKWPVVPFKNKNVHVLTPNIHLETGHEEGEDRPEQPTGCSRRQDFSSGQDVSRSPRRLSRSRRQEYCSSGQEESRNPGRLSRSPRKKDCSTCHDVRLTQI